MEDGLGAPRIRREALPEPLEALRSSIDRAMCKKYDASTFTTDADERTFMGFGSPEEIESYLTSQGIDVTELKIVTHKNNFDRKVDVYAEGREDPIYSRSFPGRAEIG